jgi:hypothetical protein
MLDLDMTMLQKHVLNVLQDQLRMELEPVSAVTLRAKLALALQLSVHRAKFHIVLIMPQILVQNVFLIKLLPVEFLNVLIVVLNA